QVPRLMPPSAAPSNKPFRVVIGTAPLGSFISSQTGTALVLLELAPVSLFAAGVAVQQAGEAAPWLLLGAVLLGFAFRAVDLEGCALFVPGGLYGLARQAFGPAASTVAASVLLIDYLAFGALAASAAGHSLAALLGPSLSQQVALDDLATTAAVCLI